MRQYTLPFTQTARYEESDFFVSSCNETAWRQVTTWPDWKSLLLVGPEGSGKTHLGFIWATRSSATIIDSRSLRPDTITGHCLIENIDSTNPNALLHAINLCKEQGFSLLLTAQYPAKRLGFTLPDLVSRLAAMPTAIIGAADDEALAGAMRKQFADRQIGVPEEVVQYLLSRCERSYASVAALVHHLDASMWQEKRNLTIAFAREVLAHYPKHSSAESA